MPTSGPPLTILCPLAAERQALERSPAWSRIRRALGAVPAVEVCGPGPRAVERWFAERRPVGPILLVGVAGGITTGTTCGRAAFVGRVVDATGTTVGDAMIPPTWTGERWRAVSVDVPAATPAAKRALAVRSHADVVDMESAALLRAARGRMQISVLRGISDGIDDQLPDGVERLVDERGATRIGAALALLVRRPSLLPQLRTLGQRTNAAIAAAAELLPMCLDRSDVGVRGEGVTG